MAAVGVSFLYLAWFLSWFGTFATTCTGSDPKSLASGLILSLSPYMVSIAGLRIGRLNAIGLALSLPLAILLARQALWAAQLFAVVNVAGRSACSHMFDEDFGPVQGGWLEYIYAPYYFSISMLSLYAIAYSYWRYRQDRKPVT